MPENDLTSSGPVRAADRLPELVRAYRTHTRMMKHPDLVAEMREVFLAGLQERGVVSTEEVNREARAAADRESAGSTPELVREYRDAIIDLLAVRNFSDEILENYINLARKRDRFNHLIRIVNTEEATSRRIKQAVKEFCAIPEGEMYMSPDETKGARAALVHHFVSNQMPFIAIAKNHITIRDVDELIDASYWSRRQPGKIGGKASGLFLAYRILLPRLEKKDPELQEYLRIPQSFYINSGVFSDFVDHNELHFLHHLKYKTRDKIDEEYRDVLRLHGEANFPPDVLEDFRGFLEKIGEHPLILRSSSRLEDNFGHAFSGKYESVFVTNQGPLDQRLREFVEGLKRVQVSMYAPAPMLYRRDHNLLDFDERMAVLVQKVVGQRFGDYFFPFSGGVAYSDNGYRWTPRIRQEDGLVRLVFGLGTRAVDRVSQDYPRMVPLSHPLLRPEVEAGQIRRYSQKTVDVLNLRTRTVESLPLLDLLQRVDHPDLFYALSTIQEGHLAAPMFKGAEVDVESSCVTFDNLLRRTRFAPLMKKILSRLREAYGMPVDIEFAWDGGKLYLLQCRPLPVRKFEGRVQIPEDVPPEDVLFTTHQVVSSAVVEDIEYLVYVDPRAYAQLASYERKLQVARAVGRLNRQLEGRRYALLGPGRWGSNDINLGVRVGYEDINHTRILGEVAFEEGGSTPEVSYGTHFFNDLMEAQITPVPIYPDRPEALLREEFLLKAPNALASLAPEFSDQDDVVHVIHLPESTGGKFLHVYQSGESQQGAGILAPRKAAARA